MKFLLLCIIMPNFKYLVFISFANADFQFYATSLKIAWIRYKRDIVVCSG